MTEVVEGPLEPVAGEEEEPLRWRLYITAFIVGVLTFLVSWGAGADWRAAVGLAAAQVLLTIGGTEIARRKVYSPASVQRAVDGMYLLGANSVSTEPPHETP